MRWAKSKPKFADIEFTRFGEERVPTDEMESVCSSLIEDVLGRMRQQNLPLETLEDAWQGVRELDEEEFDFARAAALLGADPFDLDDELADAIVEFWQGIPASLRGDSLGAVTNADSLPAVRRWIERSLDLLEQDEASVIATSGWEALRESVVQATSPIPWRRGYDLAENFRREGSVILPVIWMHSAASWRSRIVTCTRSRTGSRGWWRQALRPVLAR